jgi:hypothetical protein
MLPFKRRRELEQGFNSLTKDIEPCPIQGGSKRASPVMIGLNAPTSLAQSHP